MAGKGGGKGLGKGSGNGPVGAPKLHTIKAGASGHPVRGKGQRLSGKAY